MISKTLLKYFNGATILLSFTDVLWLLTEFDVFPTRAALYLNDWELSAVKSALFTGTLSLLNYHELPDFSE